MINGLMLNVPFYYLRKKKMYTSIKNKTKYTNYDKKRNNYRASITCIKTKKIITLGRFKTEEEAALKVNEFAIKNGYKYYRLNNVQISKS